MIQAGKPMMTAVGPVIPNNRRLSSFIKCQDQTISRLAMIGNCNYETCPLTRWLRELNTNQTGRAGVWHAGIIDGDGVQRQFTEIQIDLGKRILKTEDCYLRPGARDLG